MIIESLVLQSPDTTRLAAFYHRILECDILAKDENAFEMRFGATRVRFEQEKNATPYHFAINIPSNQIEEAAKWLQQRIEIQPGPDGDIVDFSSWKAKSIYFYDADKNIVELIARERINTRISGAFDSKQFLSISEIGLPVNHIEQTFQQLSRCASFEIFSGNFDAFCAVGDDFGLFIIIDRNKKKWFPTHDPAPPSPFSITGMQHNHPFAFSFRDDRIF